MADTIANDRFLKTPISFDDIMPKAMGEYRDSLPFLPGKITLDSQLYKDPQYLQNITDNLQQKVNIDPNNILRHEIIHAGMDKYGVKNNQINPPQNDLNDMIKRTISKSFGPNEWVTHSLDDKNGKYLNNSSQSIMSEGNTKAYQQALLHAIANSPAIHPKFKELLKRLGYGI